MFTVRIVSAAIGVGLTIAASDAAVFDLVGITATSECAGRSTCRISAGGITATLSANTGTFTEGSFKGPFSFRTGSSDFYAEELLESLNGLDNVPHRSPDVVTITFDQDVIWNSFTVSHQLAGEFGGVEFNGESFFSFDGSGAFNFYNGHLIRNRDAGGSVVLTAIAGQFSIDRFTVEPASGVDGYGEAPSIAQADGAFAQDTDATATPTAARQYDEGDTFVGDEVSSSFGGCTCDPTNDGFVDRLDLRTVIVCASRGDCSRCVNSCDVNCDGVEADSRDIRAMVRVVFRGKPCSQE